MGFIMAAFSVASVFGVPFSLYLSNIFNWHGPFFFVAGMGVILLPFLIRYLPKMDGHLTANNRIKVSPLVLLKDISKNRNQVLALVLSSTIMLGHFMIIPFLNPFLEFNKGFSKSQTPVVYMVGGALTLFASPFLGKLADRIGKHRLFIMMALTATIPIAIITNLPSVPFYAVLVVTGFWFVVSSGRTIPAQALISNVVSSERRGSFLSINSSVQQISVGLASVIAGLVVVKLPNNTLENYQITGYISIVITLVSIFVVSKLNARMVATDLLEKKKAA
jgi:predicted MFS family arabinose efflux permease